MVSAQSAYMRAADLPGAEVGGAAVTMGVPVDAGATGAAAGVGDAIGAALGSPTAFMLMVGVASACKVNERDSYGWTHRVERSANGREPALHVCRRITVHVVRASVRLYSERVGTLLVIEFEGLSKHQRNVARPIPARTFTPFLRMTTP